MATKRSAGYELTKGIIKENPLLILMLGTCPALAVTTSAYNGLGMGIASTAVLLLSNVVISLLRKVIPDKVRIPAYITIIASFVTILHLLMQAYMYDLNKELGIFIPLITVNCIILGRAEAFANKHNVFTAALDGLGMGIGFTLALFAIGGLREILGAGTFFGVQMPWIQDGGLQPMAIFTLPAGGFALYGIIVAITEKLNKRYYSQRPQKTMTRDRYPGSISERTDVVYDETEDLDGPPRRSKTPALDAVPPTVKEPGAFAKKDPSPEKMVESEDD